MQRAAAAFAIGDAQVSEMHCNFLINHGARDGGRDRGARRGGPPPRARDSGVTLEWEIKRVGVA